MDIILFKKISADLPPNSPHQIQFRSVGNSHTARGVSSARTPYIYIYRSRSSFLSDDNEWSTSLRHHHILLDNLIPQSDNAAPICRKKERFSYDPCIPKTHIIPNVTEGWFCFVFIVLTHALFDLYIVAVPIWEGWSLFFFRLVLYFDLRTTWSLCKLGFLYYYARRQLLCVIRKFL